MKKVPKRCHFWTPHFWGSLCIFGLILPLYDQTSFWIFLKNGHLSTLWYYTVANTYGKNNNIKKIWQKFLNNLKSLF
jgi:hypothetical protein